MATTINPPRDPNTLSNYNNWLSTHITANFDILFDQKKLVGNVIHKLKSITNAESTDIVLDTSHVDVTDVKVDGKPSVWELLPPVEPYGTALKIKLDQGVKMDEIVHVDVRYALGNTFTYIVPDCKSRSLSRPQRSVPHFNGSLPPKLQTRSIRICVGPRLTDNFSNGYLSERL